METQKKIQINSILITICICLIINFTIIALSDFKNNSSSNQTQVVNIGQENKEKINLNTATTEALESLPHVGTIKAQDIIDNRPYNSVWDLKKIKGIGDETIRSIEGVVECK